MHGIHAVPTRAGRKVELFAVTRIQDMCAKVMVYVSGIVSWCVHHPPGHVYDLVFLGFSTLHMFQSCHGEWYVTLA